MLILKAELMGIYRANDFVNKETGVTTIGKTKLQLLSTQTMKDGSIKKILLDVSIPQDKVHLYNKDKLGKTVEVDISIIGNVQYYGI